LISKIQEINRGPHALIYEQLLLLEKNINLELFPNKFLIIDNNLYKKYPNQSNINFIDIESNIEANQSFEENELFNFFYANSIIVDDVNYIQYYDQKSYNYQNVCPLNFFDPFSLADVNITEIYDENLPPDYITFYSPDNSYNKFKDSIFFDRIDRSINLIVDRSVLTHQENKNELKIINYVLKTNDVEINYYLKKTRLEDHYRTDFNNILFNYWKSSNFRDLIFYVNPDLTNDKRTLSQGAVIEEIVQQAEKANISRNYNDIFLTAPTGSGKSALFQIPAIYIAMKYNMVTIVVSPLKALMYDQVTALHERGITSVTFINSDISLLEREENIEKIKRGDISILYLSPELLLSYDITHFVGDRRVGLLIIDEAHLVTTWGRDFRVDYWYLGIFIRKMRKIRNNYFPVVALTATAVYGGENDMVFETISSLNMQVPKLYIGNVRRDEIQFDIIDFQYPHHHENDKIENTAHQIQSLIQDRIKAIVYFPWISQIEQVWQALDNDSRGKVGKYYSKVSREDRQEVIDNFKIGEYLVVLATKAFGMGVDINDIKVIYHHAPSGNLSDYVQEIGRVARDQSIQGIAKVDFHPKDLKFTKILYGLSSIKQYQLNMILQKLNDIYRYKKKQNFLVSIDDFAFIFTGENVDIEQKVKSSLLLLEKDLLAKYHYNVLIVRPKSLFSIVYARVNQNVEQEFIERYGDSINRIDYEEDVTTTVVTGRGRAGDATIIEYPDGRSVYEIDLNKIWEEYFARDSFPLIKKRYFDKQLFEGFQDKIIPQFKLSIILKQDKRETLQKLDTYFSILENSFNTLGGHFFTKRQLESIMANDLTNRQLRKRITDLLASIYASDIFRDESDTFLQTRRSGDEITMRVIDAAYIRVKRNIIRNFNLLFNEDGQDSLVKFISTSNNKTKQIIKLAYILESFLLGNYELVGGEMPRIFIRINDPLKINVLANTKYVNNISKDIEKRHQHSVKTMDKFFTSHMDDPARWNFIEDYFLGKDILEGPIT